MPKRYKILITGSSGMLGIDLSQELGKGYEVCGVDLVHSSLSRVRSFEKGDITNKASIAAVIKKISPDIVIHTAAWTDVDGCELDAKKAYKINGDGTNNVALACKACNATMVYISTDFVFDGRKKKAYTEKDKPNPINVYADSKLKGEAAVKKSAKKYFIIRTSWLYGKHGKNFVDIILAKARAEKVLKVVDDQVGSPTYTKDLAKAIHALVGRAKGYGIYHVTNSGSVSWYEYAKEILKFSGSVTKVLPISSEELDRPAKRPAMSILDNSKFIRYTGYTMRHWNSALREYLS